jgi:hypothetical protein
MIIIALFCLFLGGLLGQFFRVLILVPANGLVCALILTASFFSGAPLAHSLAKIGIAIVSLAGAYLAGHLLACTGSSVLCGR